MSTTKPLSYGAVVNAHVNSQFTLDVSTTTGLTFGTKAGQFSLNGVTITVPADTVTLTDDATNIVQVNPFDQDIEAVTEGNEDQFVLYRVTTAGGSITDIEDLRHSYI